VSRGTIPAIESGMKEASERSAMKELGRRSYGGILAGGGALVLAALITTNLWLMNRTLARERQTSLEHLFWVVCQPGFSANERAEAFLKLLVAENREWRSADLSGLDLPGINLSQAPLDNTDFRRSVFTRADFSGAFMGNAYLQLCDFSEANLEACDLVGADLYRANLVGATLNRAKLAGGRLQECDATGARFVAADISGGDLVMADLSGADLSGANLQDANLEGAKLRGANLSLSRFAGARLSDADFTNSSWWRARGFDAASIAVLRDQFEPTEDAPQELRDDFAEWLTDIGAN